MTFAALHNDHDQMIAIAQSIIDLATSQQHDAMAQLQSQRVDLSRTVSSHCAAEIAQIKALGSDAQVSADTMPLVRRYHSELLAWRGALMECNANWPTRRIAQDPQAFCAVFGDIVDQLVERVRWEEREFYPAMFGATAAH